MINCGEQEAIFEWMDMELEEVKADKLDDFYLYKFLIFIRQYTLFGYFNSEVVGGQVLSYIPYPGSYEGCVPLDQEENISSI